MHNGKIIDYLTYQ